MKLKYFLFLIRIIIGLIYIVSGTEKLLQPNENFLYVIQGYQLVHNPFIEKCAALIFPWIEYIIGGFLILGLWIKYAFFGVWAFSSMFIVVLSQAIIRKLPITDCGCFGDFVHLPLHIVLIMDITIWVLAVIATTYIKETSFISLDNYFIKKENKS